MADEEFEGTSSGASETYPMQCSSLRKSGHVVIKGRPCKIVDMSTSKTGKHGHAKVKMVGIDIFTERKYEDMCPSTHNMNVPHVSRVEYKVNYITDEGYFSLMDMNTSDIREDLKCSYPIRFKSYSDLEFTSKDALSDFINEKEKEDYEIMVTVVKAMGEEQIIDMKLTK